MFTEIYDQWRTSYPPSWDEAEERNDHIEAEVDARTDEGGDYYPFSFENFIEYLNEISNEAEKQSFLSLINNHALEINVLRTNAMQYWRKAARTQVEHELNHP